MMPDIEAELARAVAFRQATERKMIDMQWPAPRVGYGVARVAFYGFEREHYEPAPDGPALAFLLPVVEQGELIDIAAVDPMGMHVATRLGLGRGLGLDVLSDARMRACNLLLCSNAVTWLQWVGRVHSLPDTRLPAQAVYLFKLSDARIVLDGVDPIHCETEELANRLAAVLPPSEGDTRVMVL